MSQSEAVGGRSGGREAVYGQVSGREQMDPWPVIAGTLTCLLSVLLNNTGRWWSIGKKVVSVNTIRTGIVHRVEGR